MIGVRTRQKLGHVAFVVDDAGKMSEFYQKVLGFRVSDVGGGLLCVPALRADHHTVNFLTGKKTLHHIAFEVKDLSEIHNACELLGQKSNPIIWGSLAHGPGHNVSTYHHNPDSHVVEFYIDFDQMKDEELGTSSRDRGITMRRSGRRSGAGRIRDPSGGRRRPKRSFRNTA